MKKLLFIILSLALFTSCERKISEYAADKGTANFSTYISIGNSLVAGYADGALYHDGQLYSCPNLIAGQLQLAGGGAFIQPMVTSNYGVAVYPGVQTKLVLGYTADCQGVVGLSPVRSVGDMEIFGNVGYAVNNFGIPGAKSFHLITPGYAQMNPYYTRFATSMTGAVVEEFGKVHPTFFTMQLGDNDVLAYALAGGSYDSITQPATFYYAMKIVLGSLLATGASGVMANIPDITSIPFFTTIPYNGLVLTRQTLADSVNYAMSLYQLPFHYVVGPNPFLVRDPASPHPYFKVRQMQPGEYVLMTVPQDSLKCKGMGIINVVTHAPYPIPDQFVLTTAEVAQIKFATDVFNNIIDTMAANHHVGLVDMNSKLKILNSQSGVVWDGIHLNAKFVTGGAFSLDGIHLTPRGNALSANYFIEAINQHFGSKIPYVDVTKYKGVVFP
ncbi:MAG: hypothetical protein NTY96_10125 [Bacteroidetes bacterium]|nr:hypothetical protein [Bacteroidota bacterium]